MSKEIALERQKPKRFSFKGIRNMDRVEAFQAFNAGTAVTSLVLIGGTVGVALAAIDAAQIGAAEVYKRRNK